MKKFGYTRQDEFGNTYYTKDAYKFGQAIKRKKGKYILPFPEME